MDKAIKLMNAVFEFEQADADVARHGWTNENEPKWERAKCVMISLAHRMLEGRKEDDGMKQTNFYQVFRIDYQGQQIVSCGNGNVIYSNIEAADAAARREWREKRNGFGMGMVKSTHSEEGAYQIVTHIGTEFNWEVRDANLVMED